MVKNFLANARDVGSICGSGRSLGGGNDIPLQYPCLGNPMDRGAQWATVHGVTKSWTQLSMHTHPCLYLIASLNFFISAKSIFPRLGGVSYIQENVICKSKHFVFFLSYLDACFSFLISTGRNFSTVQNKRNFSTVQNKSGESGHPCLIPNLWKAFRVSTLTIMLVVGFIVDAFIRLRKFISGPLFFEQVFFFFKSLKGVGFSLLLF